jgi:hypothetical protein
LNSIGLGLNSVLQSVVVAAVIGEQEASKKSLILPKLQECGLIRKLAWLKLLPGLEFIFAESAVWSFSA